MISRSVVVRITGVALLTAITLTMLACSSDIQPQAPVADIVPHELNYHGIESIDNYFWLRERETQKVLDYIKAENAYTETVMKHTEADQETLFNEMRARIKEDDQSVPEKDGDYYYYTRNEAGQQYKIYCRKKGSLDAPEEIMLDANKLAVGHEYFDLGSYRVAPNDNLLAYTVDTDGSEVYTIYVKDLSTNELIETVSGTYYSMEWAADNKTLWYTTLDSTHRTYRLYRHELGDKDDKLVMQEDDLAYDLYISKTKSQEYLLVGLESNTTSEIHYLKADNPTDELQLIHPRQHEMEYSVYHHGDQFYIKTNENARNYKLMQTSVKKPSKKNWKEFIAHRESVIINGVDLFKNHIALYERKDGLKQIEVIDLASGSSHYVEFPEPVYSYYGSGNPEFNTNVLRFKYMSMVTPSTVYDYDMTNKTLDLKKQDEIGGGFDKTQYETKRIFATADDGTKVPMAIVYKKGIKLDGTNPTTLYGYGSYGANSDPGFRSYIVSLLDRGFVYAVAQIRGGGENGRSWYDDGKLMNKNNTFTDFIACAEHLIAEGYTKSDKLVVRGGSAGGLLMGAVANMRPDLFKVVVASVPFVDVINTMMDASIPLTVTEYEEWGNPNEKEYYDYMMSYSPYDNVAAKDYPDMLVTAGLNDPRVQYWEPAKWVAKLRALKINDNMLLLKTNMGAGHFGASGRYGYLHRIAFEFAFVLDCLKIKV